MNPLLKILETNRLVIRRVSLEDAEFILQLLNEPSWLRFIGDKGVRTIEDARAYISNGPLEMYARLGFGLYLVESKIDDFPMGLCGLIKRDSLADVDIGFAFLPKYWGKGYAYEAAAAVLTYGRSVLGLNRVVAITSVDNERSAKLLEKLGLRFEELIKLSAESEQIKLFGTQYYNSPE